MVINYGDLLLDEPEFNNSKEKAFYAWSYYQQGKESVAIEKFEELDIQFTNYENRIEYINFLIHTNKNDLAKE